MADTSFDAFLPYVRSEADLAPRDLCIQKIRDAAREFCEKTHCWQIVGDIYTVTINISNHVMSLPAAVTNGEAFEVMWLQIDGQFIDPATEEYLNRWNPLWRTQTGSGVSMYMQEDERSYTIVPVPLATSTTANNAQPKYFVRPLITAVDIPDRMFGVYHEQIALGAKARLKLMPKKKWSDNTGGKQDMLLFHRSMVQERAKVDMQFGRSSPMAQSPFPFANARRPSAAPTSSSWSR